MALVLLAAAVQLTMAGCGAPDPVEPSPPSSACLVTGPTDTSCDSSSTGAAGAAAPHLHDYWGGTDRLTVLHESKPSPVGFAGGPAVVARFRPEPGQVVPQGTARVNLTVSWTTNPDDVLGGFSVAAKTAGRTDFIDLGPVAQGGTLVLETAQTDNDLPHQALSGWLVDVAVLPDERLGFAHFYGDLTLTLEAFRGLEIPLYPGHPDQWLGRASIPLLDVVQPVTQFGDSRTTFYGCAGNSSCLRPLRPDQGALVPQGTSWVDATLSWDSPEPLALALWMHGAETDQFAEVQVSDSGPGTRHYLIPIQPGMPDGPYTHQSLWEFVPTIQGPVKDGAFDGNLHFTATAVKG